FIGALNPESFYGFGTRITPHWFHVWFHRVILRRENAGLPGQPRFRPCIIRLYPRGSLLKFCATINLNMIYLNQYNSVGYTRVREKRPNLGWLLYIAISLFNALTFSQRDVRLGNFMRS